jgi:hypothetical protein
MTVSLKLGYAFLVVFYGLGENLDLLVHVFGVEQDIGVLSV